MNKTMTNCIKCGSIEISKGDLTVNTGKVFFCDMVFRPQRTKLITFAIDKGTKIETESYARLKCGMVYSQCNPTDLKDYISKNCKKT
jgi:hypothetical protein